MSDYEQVQEAADTRKLQATLADRDRTIAELGAENRRLRIALEQLADGRWNWPAIGDLDFREFARKTLQPDEARDG